MAKHRDPKIKDKAILWAQKVLSLKDSYVILDTETTGLNRKDVVIEIAVIDLDGNALFNSRVRPTEKNRISTTATEIHGIRMSDLRQSPTFSEIIGTLQDIILNKTVIIYNAEFDERLIEQTCDQDDCWYLKIRTECAMIPYTEFKGQWSEYHYDYTFQALPGGNHSAIGDCKATLKVIQKMAKTPLAVTNKPIYKRPEQDIMPNHPPRFVINTNEKKQWWEFWK